MTYARVVATILLVEDDERISEPLLRVLSTEGFDVIHASTGNAGLDAVGTGRPSLVLLDLTLPDISGIEVCKLIRGSPATRDLPVVMISARVEEIDRVVGFEVGADDYITKPFSLRELVLRVRAVLRRREPARTAGDRVRCGRLSVDDSGHRAWLDEQELVLTALEFRLLRAFVGHPGRVFSREELLADVWGMAVGVTTRTVDTHILRLRDKLGPAADQLQTLRGVGYRMSGEGAPRE